MAAAQGRELVRRREQELVREQRAITWPVTSLRELKRKK
jgi:hypothetical protein